MKADPGFRVHSFFYKLLVGFLALTGLAQMPIFKRYYISDVPGLGWLADYYLTHKLHYALAAGLLFLMAFMTARWFRQWAGSFRLSVSGLVRLCILAGVVITGALRMYKNQPGVSYSPEATMIIDWTHLGLVILLGLAALVFMFFGRKSYAVAVGNEQGPASTRKKGEV